MDKEYIPLEAAITAMTADNLLEHFDSVEDAIEKRFHRAAERILASIPAADVVEVVRCRECRFWDTSWNPGVGVTGEAHYCPRCHLVTLKDSFCSGACRKEGGRDDA